MDYEYILSFHGGCLFCSVVWFMHLYLASVSAFLFFCFLLLLLDSTARRILQTGRCMVVSHGEWAPLGWKAVAAIERCVARQERKCKLVSVFRRYSMGLVRPKKKYSKQADIVSLLDDSFSSV